MISSFLQYIEFEKRYSKHTLTSYSTDLKELSTFLDSNFSLKIEEATSSLLRSWVVYLSDNGNSAKTINRKIASARSFFKYLLKEGKINADPSKKLISPKIQKKLPEFIQENQLLSLLDNLSFAQNFEETRDQLILELLYGTGIRLSELIQLEESKIDFTQRTLKVLGKGNKERIIPIHPQLINTIKNYLSFKKDEFENASTCLIVTNKGEAAYPMFIYRVVKKYLNMTITSKTKSPHVLRHTFATHLLNKGADLNAIKELMGHSSLAATQVYTHNTLDKLKNIFDQAHPKS